MNKLITVVNDFGVEFNVAVVKEFCVDVVVFYDDRYKEGFTQLGQRITAIPCAYMKKQKGRVHLQRDVQEWTLTEENVKEVIGLLE